MRERDRETEMISKERRNQRKKVRERSMYCERENKIDWWGEEIKRDADEEIKLEGRENVIVKK